MKLQYDDLVMGSGVSGMTVSLLLAGTGRRVLLLEKSNAVGGSMQRFRRNSVPFDTGFHFTTNFTGCMGDMIRMLGLEDELECVPIGTNVIIGGRRLRIPRGRDRACAYLCGEFPGEKEKIRRYFETEKRIYDNTALFDLRTPGGFTAAQFLDEDFISLADYLDSLGVSGELRAILASFALRRFLLRTIAVSATDCLTIWFASKAEAGLLSRHFCERRGSLESRF